MAIFLKNLKVRKAMNRLGLGLGLILIIASLMIITCGEKVDKTTIEAATASAKAWVALIDSNRYDESWDHSAEAFKKTLTKEQWRATITPVREPLGSVTSRNVKSKEFTKTLPGVPDGSYVVIKCETSFQNKQSAVETIVMTLEKDNKWRVAGYFIK